MTPLEELRDLLERAAYDLAHGWPEAALDCIGRALRLFEPAEAPKEKRVQTDFIHPRLEGVVPC